MELNYGIIVYVESSPETVVHFCGYESPPTEDDYKWLKEELAADEEFGLTEIMSKLKYREASKWDIVYMKRLLKGVE